MERGARNFLLIILFIILLGNSTLAQSVNPTPFIVFWNLENYFDPFDDKSKDDDEFTPSGTKHWTWKRFLRKRNDIAKVIISFKEIFGDFPPIVGFAEVENRYVLEELLQNTPLVKLDYKLIHFEGEDKRGIDCAMIYREGYFKPFSCNSLAVELPDSSTTRDILQVKGTFWGDTLEIFVAHFPSKLGGAQVSDRKRERAMKRLYDAIVEGKSPNVVVMGDFNDTPDSEVFYGLPDFMELMGQNGVIREGSIKYKGVWELIDNFIISNPYSNRWRFGVYTLDYLLEEDLPYLGRRPRRCFIGPMYNGGVSDHLPVYISRVL